VTASPTRRSPTIFPRAVHGTNGGNPEPDWESRLAEPGMGNAQPTSQTRLGWVQKDTEEGAVANRSGAGVLKSYAGIHPYILPAKSAALHPATNGFRERSNSPPPLHDGAVGQTHGGREKDWPRSQRPWESQGIC
jgi:hypothetical protein